MKNPAADRAVYSPVTKRAASDLRSILGPSGVTPDPEKRAAHSADKTLPCFERDYPAEAARFPETTEKIIP